jgi:hypothetical protein
MDRDVRWNRVEKGPSPILKDQQRGKPAAIEMLQEHQHHTLRPTGIEMRHQEGDPYWLLHASIPSEGCTRLTRPSLSRACSEVSP